MIEQVLFLSFVVALWFVGYQVYKVAGILEQKHLPQGINEEAVEHGENEPEPRRGR